MIRNIFTLFVIAPWGDELFKTGGLIGSREQFKGVIYF